MMEPSEVLNLELAAKAIGVCWKQASVRFDANGQSRYWSAATTSATSTFEFQSSHSESDSEYIGYILFIITYIILYFSSSGLTKNVDS